MDERKKVTRRSSAEVQKERDAKAAAKVAKEEFGKTLPPPAEVIVQAQVAAEPFKAEAVVKPAEVKVDKPEVAVMEKPVEVLKTKTVEDKPAGPKKAKERQVLLMRKISFIQESNASDPSVSEYFGMAYKAVGSYFKEFGKIAASGLTRAEAAILMPELTGY